MATLQRRCTCCSAHWRGAAEPFPSQIMVGLVGLTAAFVISAQKHFRAAHQALSVYRVGRGARNMPLVRAFSPVAQLKAMPQKLAVRDQDQRWPVERQGPATGRRAILVLPLLAPALSVMSAAPDALAAPLVLNKEVDNESSPFVQELLRRTEEKREQRKKERLDDYYRRNFREYFEYSAGNIKAGNRDGLDSKTAEEILQWLEQNDQPTMPGLRAQKGLPF